MPLDPLPALTLIGAEVRYESLRTTLIVTDVSSEVVAAVSYTHLTLPTKRIV